MTSKDTGPPASTSVLQVVQSADGQSDGASVSVTLGEPLRILPGRREVYEATLSSGKAIVAKGYLPHPKQDRDWRREWNGLVRLNQLDLAAPKPVCVATDPVSGTVWVIMKYIRNMVPLQQAFAEANACQAETLAFRLIRLLDAAHDKGVAQADQHIDNWGFDGSQIYMLDAGTVTFSPHALGTRRVIADLAALYVTLAIRDRRLFQLAILQHYLNTNPEEKLPVIAGRRLVDQTARYQKKRLLRYYNKTRRNCTEFGRKEKKGAVMLFSRGAAADLVEQFWADPEALMQTGERLKSGNTCTVQSVAWADRRYVLKRYNLKPFASRLRRALSDSRALKSWSHGWVLEMAFIPTARPVAVYEERRAGLRGRCYLLMEQIDGQLLPDYVAAQAKNPKRLEVVADAVAEIWTGLAEIRAVHGDLKATNWIVDSEHRVHLIDLDSFEFGCSKSAFARGRKKDRARFMKNWSYDSALERLFRQRLGRDDMEAPVYS